MVGVGRVDDRVDRSVVPMEHEDQTVRVLVVVASWRLEIVGAAHPTAGDGSVAVLKRACFAAPGARHGAAGAARRASGSRRRAVAAARGSRLYRRWSHRSPPSSPQRRRARTRRCRRRRCHRSRSPLPAGAATRGSARTAGCAARSGRGTARRAVTPGPDGAAGPARPAGATGSDGAAQDVPPAPPEAVPPAPLLPAPPFAPAALPAVPGAALPACPPVLPPCPALPALSFAPEPEHAVSSSAAQNRGRPAAE